MSAYQHGEGVCNQRPIGCPLCSKTFTLWSHYETHKKCHQKLKQRQYPCQSCGKVIISVLSSAGILSLNVRPGNFSDLHLGQQQEHAPADPQGSSPLPVRPLWGLLQAESSPTVSPGAEDQLSNCVHLLCLSGNISGLKDTFKQVNCMRNGKRKV